MSEQLRECPCCGSEAVLESMKVRKGWEADAHCNSCLLSMHTITYDTEEEAISAATTDWNSRTQPDNEALTLDELREELHGNSHGWLWLEALNDDAESLYQRNDTTSKWSNITNYGKTWLAYRRKPEETP